jgi:DNA invertase Pin-like site-specific DNA recombinase
MGRLVLNMLLSFAQFERELIAERTRDKIAAARRKGMASGADIPVYLRIVADRNARCTGFKTRLTVVTFPLQERGEPVGPHSSPRRP